MKDWTECKLGDLLTLKNGYAFKSTKYISNGIPVLRIGDINNWLVNSENAKCVEENSEYENYVVSKGDILIAMSGATTGKFGIYKSEKKAYQNQRVGNLIPHSDKYIVKNYLYLLLYSLKNQIEKDAYGGAQPNISANKIESLSIEFAPLPEQRAIVAKIEQLFSELDNGIANLKTTQEQLKVYRQAVLKKAFEGNWTLIELEKISDAVSGYAFKSKDFIENGKYQIIRIGNIRPGYLRLNESPVFVDDVEEKILNKALLRNDDVVITLTGTRKKRDYGFTTLVNKGNLLLNQRIAYLRFTEKYLPKFFLYYSWTEEFKQQFFDSETGNVGQGNVGMKSIRETLVPLPNIEEQHQIVQQIESRLSVCDKVEETIAVNLQKAEALRQSILKKAFAGELLTEAEIAACKKEKDWEPAGELLKRIKEKKL